ncbi:MAG: hypothetical protein ACI9F9_002269, partial [Candidatus Paceibacteria bacterium]
MPLILATVLAGVWVCNEYFGGTGAEVEASGTGGVLHAADGDALLMPGLQPGADGQGPLGGERRAVLIATPVEGSDASEEKEPAPEYETRLTGTVTQGNAAVEGARVMVRETSSWFSPPADVEEMRAMTLPGHLIEAITDEEGRFSLYDVPAGKVALAIRSPGLAPVVRPSLEIPEHEDYDLGSFQMQPGIRILGTVSGSRGEALEGVQVLSAISKEAGSVRLELPGIGIPLTKTGPEGEFEIEGLAPGSWHLIFDSPQHRVVELQGTTEPEGQVERGVRVQMGEGLAIRGTVTGLPETSAGSLRVMARRSEEQPSAAADEVKGAERFRARHAEVLGDGSFVVLGLAPGTQYKLRLSRPSESKNGQDANSEDLHWTVVRGVEDCLAMAGTNGVEFKYREEASVVLNITSSK